MKAAYSQTCVEVLDSVFENHPELNPCKTEVYAAAGLLIEAFSSGRKLLTCGNGGSAADSEHIVGELMKSFRFKRSVSQAFLDAYREANGCEAPAWLEGALPAISLVSQTAFCTAFSNDESATGIFAQQVYGYGKPGDILLVISTSGSSANVIEAAKVARALEIRVIALTGQCKSVLMEHSDICIQAPHVDTFRIQELHLIIYHALCAAVEAELFGEAE